MSPKFNLIKGRLVANKKVCPDLTEVRPGADLAFSGSFVPDL